MKKIIILFVLVMMSGIVYGVNDTWTEYGYEKNNLFNPDYQLDVNISWHISMQNYDNFSKYSPLIDDLNGDGVNEIIVMHDTILQLFTGENFTVEDTWNSTYYFRNITGAFATADFISGDGGLPELMVVTNTVGTNHSLIAIGWNGTDFEVEKEITQVQPSSGLKCFDYEGDDSIDCMYFGLDTGFYIYDEDDTVPRSAELYLGDNSCNYYSTYYSVPTFIDFDEDGDDDIYVIWGSACNKVYKIQKNAGYSWTNTHNYTFGYDVTGIAMADLDGGQKELVVSYSKMCARVGTPVCTGNGYSGITILDIVDDTTKCGATIEWSGSGNSYTPYVAGLHTCYDSDIGNCDYNDDGYDDIYTFVTSTGGGARRYIFNSTCGVLDYTTLSDVAYYYACQYVATGRYEQAYRYAKSTWADFDGDGDDEIFFGEYIFEKNGTSIWQIPLVGSVACQNTYYVLGEVTGDDTVDIVMQGDNLPFPYGTPHATAQNINVFSYNGTRQEINYSCVDGDYGTNLTIRTNTTLYVDVSPADIYEDACYNTTHITEGTCGVDEIVETTYDCKDYGYLSCYDGACIQNQRPTLNSVESYREEIGAYLDKHHHVYYALDDIIWFEVNATDPNGDSIYTAVDCDTSYGPPYVSYFGPANSNNTLHNNCTWNVTGNYTSRIFITDGEHGWADFDTYLDYNITIKECVNFNDCDEGYQCSDGVCYIPGNVTNCTDSDGGIDENVTGWVETLWDNTSDECYSGSYVSERYCDPSSPTGYSTAVLSCGSYGVDWICWQGRCTNQTNASTLNLYVRDYDTNLPLSGIDFWFVQYPSYAVVFNGTVSNGQQELSIELGYSYQVPLEDPNNVYKDWTEWYWTPGDTGSDLIASMERHCTGSCVFREYFGYSDSPRHHGWKGSNHSTYYDATLGFVGDIDLNNSLSTWYTDFPSPVYQYTEIIYELTMADETPADGQDLSVYIEDSDGDDVFVMRYVIDESSSNHVYYFTTSWNEIPLSTGYISTSPITTKLVYDRTNGKMDIYIDSSNTGNYVLYVDDVSVIDTLDLGMISFNPATPTYYRNIYVDNIEFYQYSYDPQEYSEDDPTNPDILDVTQPWYRDATGELVFDGEMCTELGYKSMIWCAGSTWVRAKIASTVAWVFTGIHILYFIVIILIIVLVGPLIVEMFRPRR